MWERTCMVLVLAAAILGCDRTPEPSGKEKTDEGAAQLSLEGKSIELFVGSASKPATEEAAAAFQKETGCEMLLHFGGSGKMLSDMALAERGDLYFPGSSDFMAKATAKKLVAPDTEKIIVYLIPAINVPAGNPKNIAKLADLGNEGVRVGIGRPDTVCVGLYAVEVLQKNDLLAKVKPNIKVQQSSCARTAQLVALGVGVDAVLGWRVFEYWNPEKIKTILLDKGQVPRIGYIPIARSVFCKQPEAADAFVDFLLSDAGKTIFRKWSYLTTEAEARAFVGPDTPVGGEWALPENW